MTPPLSAQSDTERPICDGCDDTRLVYEPCQCYQCEYDDKHSRWVACANCALPEEPSS